MHRACIYWMYACTKYACTQFTGALCTHMLSVFSKDLENRWVFMRTLSICMHRACVKWADAYTLHAYAQCTCARCTRMLSVFFKKTKKLWVFMRTDPKNWSGANPGKNKYMHARCMRMHSVRVHRACVCWAYAYQDWNTLSIRLHFFCRWNKFF